jgi:BirA family biotin operon repressor/biotin-[acetyl-CoA-carboxylase] ligase
MRPTPITLLRLLADARPRAPEALVHAAGASRAEVEDALRALEAAGAPLLREADGAVRLEAPPDLLDQAAIADSLRAAGCPVRLSVVEQCESTNAMLMTQAASGLAHGSAAACEMQTAGRGRRGRSWFAPVGGALAFSLLWRMPQGGAALGGLSLAAGVACVRALERCGVRGVSLKWPNDLVHAGRKLGGVLIEATPDGAGAVVVCGVGLNTRMPAALCASLGQPVTDVASIVPLPPSRNRLLAALLVELAAAMQRFADEGFASFRDDWVLRHAHQGMRVRVALGEARAVEGQAIGVDEQGALLLEHAGRIERFHSGEVSVRAVP